MTTKQLRTKSIIALQRGCGYRLNGHTYVINDVQEMLKSGLTMSAFIYDPPIPIDPASLGVCPQGISFITDAKGVTHAVRWVGEDNYPFPADFVEEASVLGASSLIPQTVKTGLTKLEVGKSKMLFLHNNAIIANPDDILRLKQTRISLDYRPDCFCQEDTDLYNQHIDPLVCDMCSGLWWQCLPAEKKKAPRQKINRVVGSTIYEAACLPFGEKLSYEIGLIMWLPITELQLVVNDPNRDQDRIKQARKFLSTLSNIPVVEVHEQGEQNV